MLILLATSGFVANAQYKARIGFGVSDIAFLKYGQSPYLGYEINSLIHRLPRLSFQAGISRPFQLTDRFELNPGLLFSLQGLNYNSEFRYDDIKYRIDLYYLKAPVLFEVKTGLKKNKQSGIYIGPYAALKLNATRVTRVDGVWEKEKVNNVNRFDFGGILGYSMEVGRKPNKTFIDIRCSYSLINSMNLLEGSIPAYLGPEKEYVRNVAIILAFEYKL